MAKLKTHSLFASVSSSGQTADLDVPAGTTIIVQSVDFSGPSFAGIGSKLIKDPLGSNETVAASAGDKYIAFPMGGIELEGGTDVKLRIELKKVGPGAAVLLGCVVLYEEL